MLRIQTVMVFPNGMATVCDQHGDQMPQYQGRWDDVREAVYRDAPADTEWHGCGPPKQETAEC